MNTKFFYALLAILLVLVAAAVVPAVAGSSSPTAIDAQNVSAGAQPAPVAGGDTAAVTGGRSDPRLWSGEVFLSDNGSPDRALKIESGVQPKTQSGCMSDRLPRRHGGCVE